MLLWLYQYLRRRSKPPYVPMELANHRTASGWKSDLTLNKRRLHPPQAVFVIAAALWALLLSILISFHKAHSRILTILTRRFSFATSKKKNQTIVGSLASPRASHRLKPGCDRNLFIGITGIVTPLTMTFQSFNLHTVAFKIFNGLIYFHCMTKQVGTCKDQRQSLCVCACV